MRGQYDSLARAIRGPVTLITVGALFALNNFTPYSFDKTWPVILIVFGLLTLLGRGMASPPPPTGYTQSPYAQPPAAAGGSGTSAAPRANDAGQTPPERGGSV
jgi:hypothetical protein